MKYTNETLNEREKTHGDWKDTAATYVRLRSALASPETRMEPMQVAALDMIAMKLARVVHGNPDEPDHWRDIAGYAELIASRLSAVVAE